MRQQATAGSSCDDFEIFAPLCAPGCSLNECWRSISSCLSRPWTRHSGPPQDSVDQGTATRQRNRKLLHDRPSEMLLRLATRPAAAHAAGKEHTQCSCAAPAGRAPHLLQGAAPCPILLVGEPGYHLSDPGSPCRTAAQALNPSCAVPRTACCTEDHPVRAGGRQFGCKDAVSRGSDISAG